MAGTVHHGAIEKGLLGFAAFLAIGPFTQTADAQVVQGTLDRVKSSTCEVAGWARDPQNVNPIRVRIYRDGDTTSGVLVATFSADSTRSDLPFPDKNHAFDNIFVSETGLADGRDHTINAYGVTKAGSVAPLNANGKALHCGVLNATVTRYGAKGDGVTDDSDAIQNAINDTAPGGTVFVPSGTYIIATSHATYATYGPAIANSQNSCGVDPNQPQGLGLNITKTNITLMGEGRSSILKLGPSAKMVIINLAGPHALLSKLVFDGNGAKRLRRDPKTRQILNYPCGLVAAGLITGDERTIGKSTIDDCEIRNALEDGAGMFLSPSFTVRNSYVHDNGGIAQDALLGQAAGAQAISLSGGANSTAVDNVVVGNTYGIAAGFGSVGVNISYNVILGNCDGGLILGGANSPVPPPVPDSNFKVSHNWVELNGPKSGSPIAAMPCNRPGVIILGGQHGVFADNYVWNNPFYAGLLSTDHGAPWPASVDWQIRNNDIESNQMVGINILPRSSQFVLQGNRVINNGNSLALQVAIDPSVARQINADWSTANNIRYSPPLSNPPHPAITSAGIVNAASGAGGGISPGEILVIHGSNLGPNKLVSAAANPDGRYERILSGTRVLFDGVPGVLWYTSARQAAVIAPYYLYWRDSTTVQVEYNGIKSNRVVVPVVASAPGIFTADSSGKGQGAILNQDYSSNSPKNPAASRSIVILYATGEGQTDPAGTDGLLATVRLPRPRLPVSVTIGGMAAEVLYAGAAPGFVAGSMQINARIPANVLTGASVPVRISIAKATSPEGVTLAVH